MGSNERHDTVGADCRSGKSGAPVGSVLEVKAFGRRVLQNATVIGRWARSPRFTLTGNVEIYTLMVYKNLALEM